MGGGGVGGSGDPFFASTGEPMRPVGCCFLGALELQFEFISLGGPGPGPGSQEARACVRRP